MGGIADRQQPWAPPARQAIKRDAEHMQFVRRFQHVAG
jgi:hypothetical protein